MLILLGPPGGWEIFAVIFAVLILFGGKKIPELMRGLGQGIREFNSAKAQVKDELEKGMKDDSTNNSTEAK